VAGSNRWSDDRAFSTAGSLLVVFVGLYLAFGGLYGATANTGERISQAREAARESATAVAETKLTIETAVWNASANESHTNLTVEVNNTGDRTVRLPAIDTLVDNTRLAMEDYERVEVNGRDTDLWRPGERLFLRDQDTVDGLGGSPTRVKVIADVGVADASGVTNV
jgi:archaellum component FlaF (FlaF/FlaG flagellin family)